jgi:hypothetical protein
MRMLAAGLLWLLLLAVTPTAGSEGYWLPGSSLADDWQTQLPGQHAWAGSVTPAALLRSHELGIATPRLPELGSGPADADPVVLVLASLLAVCTALLLWQRLPVSLLLPAARQRRPAAPRAPPCFPALPA